MWDALRRDLGHALRRLRRQRTSTITSIATIALVAGAGTSLFAVVSATLIRPLPYPHGDRLVMLYTLPPGTSTKADRGPLHGLDLLRFRERLQQAEAVDGAWARDRALGGGDEPISVDAAQVTSGFLALLGARPIAGHFWSDAEDRAAAKVVVLGHGLWQRHFGGDPGIVGRVITLDRQSFEVIGVANDGFKPSVVESELWTPLDAQAVVTQTPRNTVIQTIARLRAGATMESLGAEMTGLIRELAKESPATHSGWNVGVMSLREQEFGDNRTAFLMLGAAVVLVALIAVANLANLRLARVMAERTELAMRTALGARPWDLVRLQIVEGAVVGLAGCAGAVLVAAAATPALLSIDQTAARALGAVPTDVRTVAVACALALTVSIVSGLIPVLRETRRREMGALSAGHRTTGSRRDARLRRTLVAGESALALVLLVSGALIAATLVRITTRDQGFDPSQLLAGHLRLPESAYPTPGDRSRLVTDVLARVRAIPGVVAATTTLNPFVRNFNFVTIMEIEGRLTPDGSGHTVQFRRVSAGYFETMRIRVVEGRAFDDRDGPESLPVAMVSEALARQYFPGESPIGRRVLRAKTLVTIIGVAADVYDLGASQPARPTIYVAYTQNNVALTPATLVVRVAGDPTSVVPGMRAAVREADPNLPIRRLGPIEDFLDDSVAPDRFRGTLLAVFAMLGVLIAAVGIYGVTACLVQERKRELGVRLMLGASPGEVWRLILGQSLGTVGLGAAGGAVLAVILAFLLQHAVPHLDWRDGWAAVPALGVLAITAALAAGLPAFRALKSDPMEALRQ